MSFTRWIQTLETATHVSFVRKTQPDWLVFPTLQMQIIRWPPFLHREQTYRIKNYQKGFAYSDVVVVYVTTFTHAECCVCKGETSKPVRKFLKVQAILQVQGLVTNRK